MQFDDEENIDGTESVRVILLTFILCGCLTLFIIAVLSFPMNSVSITTSQEVSCPCGCGAVRGEHWYYYTHNPEAYKHLDDPYRCNENVYMYKDGKRYTRTDGDDGDWFNDHLVYKNFVQPYR